MEDFFLNLSSYPKTKKLYIYLGTTFAILGIIHIILKIIKNEYDISIMPSLLYILLGAFYILFGLGLHLKRFSKYIVFSSSYIK